MTAEEREELREDVADAVAEGVALGIERAVASAFGDCPMARWVRETIQDGVSAALREVGVAREY